MRFSFFSTEAKPKILSVLVSPYIGELAYQVRFHSINSLTRLKSAILFLSRIYLIKAETENTSNYLTFQTKKPNTPNKLNTPNNFYAENRTCRTVLTSLCSRFWTRGSILKTKFTGGTVMWVKQLIYLEEITKGKMSKIQSR